MVQQHLARVLAALAYGNQDKMALLWDYLEPALNFYRLDAERAPEDEQKLELFCVLTQAVERNEIGNTLKEYLVKMGVVKSAVEYVTVLAPCVKPSLLGATESDELKAFVGKPALRCVTGVSYLLAMIKKVCWSVACPVLLFCELFLFYTERKTIG